MTPGTRRNLILSLLPFLKTYRLLLLTGIGLPLGFVPILALVGAALTGEFVSVVPPRLSWVFPVLGLQCNIVTLLLLRRAVSPWTDPERSAFSLSVVSLPFGALLLLMYL